MPETTRFLSAGNWNALAFEPFRQGVDIHWIHRFAADAPGVALLRYQPGASVPRHRHAGLETILVLDGEQSDEAGDYGPGSFIVNAEGSQHSVWSRPGCVVLIQWQTPVIILEETSS
ncbi:cupin domain-containing protein [Pleomorphomonas koreensis]|uniref:cupin domain-containing protein n=1 Tax=Pleomorphomonas koreensis TaxID=257440 RepID=UPI00040A1476|nr:cupin domain-containing protein [Pleomorphomonas koreensis]